ncbi:E3 ubiquitin-protein ligase RHF2A [Acorus gramineus]|uniref:E3 ubiquitin-protein ligase RHF2A n=1 Tax=Acorus gramineus TaxID=55184 RepID=A0AAV9B3Z1_ACOGR|nr:E3 ubiquitin-protein ligase RHF2A [Acorus gramineus]
MGDTMKTESHLTSAAAFVEGGIQAACDDACSICLEDFCDSDPSTVSAKLSMSHVLAINQFEGSYQLPVGANDSELEERIIQHLAAAAARAHHIGRREGHRGRSSAQGRPQYLVFSTHANAPPSGSVSMDPGQGAGGNEVDPTLTAASPLVPLTTIGEEPSQQVLHLPSDQVETVPAMPSGTVPNSSNRPVLSNNRNTAGQSSPVRQDRAGPSDYQSFSESFKSHLNAVSMRYKESIAKSTRGWKERFFPRNSSVADIGSEVRKEVNAGIATVSRLMERLDTRDSSRADGPSVTHSSEVSSDTGSNDEPIRESHSNAVHDGCNASSSCAATSGSN